MRDTKPRLQQVPIRSDLARQIRAALVKPRDLDIDFASIELRLLAQEQTMGYLDDVQDGDRIQDKYEIKGTGYVLHTGSMNTSLDVFLDQAYLPNISQDLLAAFRGHPMNHSTALRICEWLRDKWTPAPQHLESIKDLITKAVELADSRAELLPLADGEIRSMSYLLAEAYRRGAMATAAGQLDLGSSIQTLGEWLKADQSRRLVIDHKGPRVTIEGQWDHARSVTSGKDLPDALAQAATGFKTPSPGGIGFGG